MWGLGGWALDDAPTTADPAAARGAAGDRGGHPVRSSAAFSEAHGDRDTDYFGVAHLLAHWDAHSDALIGDPDLHAIARRNWYADAHDYDYHAPGAHSHYPRDADAGDSADDDVELLA